jgi:lysophospholipase L1-like esterase
MHRRLLLGTVMALVMATANGLVGTASADAVVRVMPLGDSITHGYNVPGGYRIELEKSLVAGGYEKDFVGSMSNGPAELADRQHEGHEGWRIDQIAANVDPWLARYQPQVVLLLIGTNDVLQVHQLNTAGQRLSALIDQIALGVPAAEILVSSLPPLGTDARDERVRRFNDAIPGVVAEKAASGGRVTFVDMYPALTRADLADGVHPNETGYGRMAAVWYSALAPILDPVDEPTPTPTPEPTPTPMPTPEPTPGPTATPESTPTSDSEIRSEVQSVPSHPGDPQTDSHTDSAAEPDVFEGVPSALTAASRRLVAVRRQTLRVDRRGRLRVHVRCVSSDGSACTGVLVVQRPGRRATRLASRRFVIKGGTARYVRLRLNRARLGAIHRRRAERVSIRTRVRDSSGALQVTRSAATLAARAS